jgi:outer membrane protein
VAMQRLEQQFRATENVTRQSYLGVMAGISKIAADRKAIQSAKSSLEGMEAGYRVGTEILVNVLNQQQAVFENEVQYAHDRYQYVNDLLALKQAAGTLSPNDLMAINAWLLSDTTTTSSLSPLVYKNEDHLSKTSVKIKSSMNTDKNTS